MELRVRKEKDTHRPLFQAGFGSDPAKTAEGKKKNSRGEAKGQATRVIMSRYFSVVVFQFDPLSPTQLLLIELNAD